MSYLVGFSNMREESCCIVFCRPISSDIFSLKYPRNLTFVFANNVNRGWSIHLAEDPILFQECPNCINKGFFFIFFILNLK